MALYTTDILRLASSLVADDRLGAADGIAESRSIICGSRITAEVALADGLISGLAIRASACAMGQASAAIMHNNAIGATPAAISDLRADMQAFLQGKGEVPAIWPQLSLLAPARDYPARHAAILLPFDAVLAAVNAAESAKATAA